MHIVGGEKGDAFIAFSNDEDARQAMARDGGTIKDGSVKLMLSSRSEMKQVIEQARNATIAMKGTTTADSLNNKPTVKNDLTSINVAAAPIHTSTAPADYGGVAVSTSSTAAVAAAEQAAAYDQAARLNQLYGQSRPGLDNAGGNGLNPNAMHSRVAGYVDHSSHLNNPAMTMAQANALASAGVMGGLAMESLQPMAGLSQMYPQIGGDLKGSVAAAAAAAAVAAGALGQMSLPPTIDRWTVELRGLPFSIEPQEIQDFFRAIGLFVQKDNTKILVDERGFTTGGAIVKLHTQKDFELALLLNKRFLGSRRIDVMPMLVDQPFPPVLPPAALAAAGHNALGLGMALGPIAGGAPTVYDALVGGPGVSGGMGGPFPLDHQAEETEYESEKKRHTLFMKGIPFGGCNEADIKQFFSPIPVSDVVVLFEKSGKPSGDAYVEFVGEANLEAAMLRNRKYMGHRYIELFPVSKHELRRAKQTSLAGRPVTGPAARGGFRGSGSGVTGRKTHCIQITGLPPTANNRDLTNYFGEVDAPPYAVHIMLQADGLNAGEAFAEFVSLEHQRRALRRDGEMMGNYRVSCQSVAHEFMQKVVGLPETRQSPSPPSTRGGGGRFRGGGSRGRRGRSRSPQRSRTRSRSVESRGGHDGSESGSTNGGCMVLMENIAARATEEDLCAFLEEYGIDQSKIRLESSNDGQVASIEFPGVSVAERAIRQKDRKYLIGRCISMKRA